MKKKATTHSKRFTEAKLNINKPLVSIIIPIYNAEEYIDATLNSALSQTYSNIEIICIDDCSTDRSKEIVKKYRAKNVKLIELKRNAKVSIARNKAIEQANGEIILPLDADDMIDHTYVAKAIHIFCTKPDISVVYSKCKQFNNKKEWVWNLRNYSPQHLLYENHVFCSAFFRKSDWEKYNGYNSNMIYGYEDWDFWLNFVEDKKKFYRIPEYLFFYRQKDKDGISVKLRQNKTNMKLMEKQIRINHPNLYKYHCFFRFISRMLFQIKINKNGKIRIKIFKLPIYIPLFLSKIIKTKLDKKYE